MQRKTPPIDGQSALGPIGACTRGSGRGGRLLERESSYGPPMQPSWASSVLAGWKALGPSLSQRATPTPIPVSPTESTRLDASGTPTVTITRAASGATYRRATTSTCGGVGTSILASGGMT